MRRIAASFVLVALCVAVLPAGAQERQIGDTQVFAQVGAPGMPEGIIVRDGVVYVSTHTSVRGNAGGARSRIFLYDLATGALIDQIEIAEQDLSENHGVLAMAFDDEGRLYVVDRNPGRVVRVDLSASPPQQEVYATIPDLPACGPSGGTEPCSPTTLDQATFADYITFGPSGEMYVTDLEAATIFRIDNDGVLPRTAEPWFSDARFDGVFGLNGITVGPDGRLYFAMTGSQQPQTPLQGVVYSLPVVDEPTAEDLEVFFTYLEPAAGPDGIAFGASGNLYVALAGHSQVSILRPDGTEMVRFPDPVSNQQADVPYDLPASIAFDGDGSILVTNQSFFTATPDHWVVFDAWVNDTAFGLIEPTITA